MAILGFTAVIVICTLVIMRRASGVAEEAPVYLDSPTWWGTSAGGRTTDDLSSPACPAPELPEGARVRRAEPGEIDERLLEDVARGLERIPPLPHVLTQVLGELQNVGSSARSVGSIVATEPVLSAAVLRVANSAAMGLSREIVSVQDAVSYLGYSTVTSLVLRLKLAPMLSAGRADGYDGEKLWLHSLVVGQLAGHLAKRVGGVDPSFATTIGLLHDIGKLAINSQFASIVGRLREQRVGDESFLARERRLFGADHAFIGAFLAARWRLPADVVEAIRLHHLCASQDSSGLSPELRRAVTVVHISNQLAKYAHVYCTDMEIDIVPETMLAELGLGRSLEGLLTRVQPMIARAMAVAQVDAPAQAAK